MIKNQKGFTLTELIAGIGLVSLLFVGFTIFLIQFVNNFKEINEFNTLQHELLSTIEAMRYGYVKVGVNENESLMWLMTANKFNISTFRPVSSSISLCKVASKSSPNSFVPPIKSHFKCASGTLRSNR